MLNEWAASDLGAKPRRQDHARVLPLGRRGPAVRLERADSCSTRLCRSDDQAADRDLVPDYPGITETENIADWDPPFPVDLKRVRPRDEDYWHRYRTTPKAFIPLDAGHSSGSRDTASSRRFDYGPSRHRSATRSNLSSRVCARRSIRFRWASRSTR